jgi:hypothetical protein
VPEDMHDLLLVSQLEPLFQSTLARARAHL